MKRDAFPLRVSPKTTALHVFDCQSLTHVLFILEGLYRNPANGGGCTPCDCNPMGTLSAVCDQDTGQCECITSEVNTGIGGRRCDTCLPGFYNLRSKVG